MQATRNRGQEDSEDPSCKGPKCPKEQRAATVSRLPQSAGDGGQERIHFIQGHLCPASVQATFRVEMTVSVPAEVLTDSLPTHVTGEPPCWRSCSGERVAVPISLCSVCVTNPWKFVLPQQSGRCARCLFDWSHLWAPPPQASSEPLGAVGALSLPGVGRPFWLQALGKEFVSLPVKSQQ